MLTRIELDGWAIRLDWGRVYYRQSFFIPSVNLTHDRQALLDSAKQDGKLIKVKRVVENGVQGLRVWGTSL